MGRVDLGWPDAAPGLLGETSAAAVHALDHGPELHGEALAVALLGASLGFLYWVGYFRRAGGNAERHIDSAAAGRSLRLWVYGHIPLYLGIASLGAGTVHLAHHIPLEGPAPWVFGFGAAFAMSGITLVSLATHGRPPSSGLPYFLAAAMAAAMPLVVSTAPLLVGGILIVAAFQIAMSLVLQGAR